MALPTGLHTTYDSRDKAGQGGLPNLALELRGSSAFGGAPTPSSPRGPLTARA